MQTRPDAFNALSHSSLEHSAGGGLSHETTRPAELLESTELLKGGKSVSIMHNGSLYRLQATRLGKLILTK